MELLQRYRATNQSLTPRPINDVCFIQDMIAPYFPLCSTIVSKPRNQSGEYILISRVEDFMDKTLSQRKTEFGVYSSALVDLKADMPYLCDRKHICNVDFSLYYPFFWSEQQDARNFTDRVRLSLFSNYVDNAKNSRMQFVYTRATLFEIESPRVCRRV